MRSRDVSLADQPKAFMDKRVGPRCYGISGEYLRDLIRKNQDRKMLRCLLLAKPHPSLLRL